MAIDFNKLRKKPVQEESTDIDSLIDSVFAEDNVQEPVAEVQEQPRVIQEQPKQAEQPNEGGFWSTYLGDTIEKIGAGLQNFSANTYGLLDKGARKINDLVGDTRGAHTDATGKAQSGFFGEVGKAAKESVTDLRAKSDRYKGKNFVELWKDDKAAAVGDVFLQASESLPQSLMAAFTGPLGTVSIGATVANEKYDQLDESNPNMGESQKMLNALLTGTAEAGSEYLGSVPVGKWLKGMYSKMGAKAAEEQLQKGLTGWIGTNAKKLGVLFPPVAEGVEEIASQVAENITDWATGARPDLNPMEGAFESFVYGAGGGAQFSAMSLPAYGAKVVNKVKTGHDFRKASKEFSSLFEDESVDDVVSGLSSMTPEEQTQWLNAINYSDYTEEQKNAATNLLTTTLERNAARSPEEYASMREESERMLIDSEMKRFEDASRPYISDNGRYQQVKLGEEDVYITGGTVGYKQNEFGEYVLDLDSTSEELYYVDSEGNTQVTTGKAITEIVDIADYEQEYNEYLQHVTNAVKQRNQLQESISQEVTIENGDPVQYMGPDGNLIDGIAADTSLPEVITLEDGTVVPRENVIPNTQGAAINPPADLQTEQPTAQTGLQTEQQPVQPVQDGTQVVEQPAPVFPVDKNNNIDYSQISEPEMYAQALQSEFDNEAVDVIDEQIQSAQARLDKASKNTDAIARRRAMKVEQAEVERLNKVKEILTPVQQNVSETALETSGNANPLQAEQSIMSEEELSMLAEPERRVYVAENSNDPLELADLYEQVKDETEYSEMLPWQAALLGRRVNKDSFVEHSDKNNITGAIAKSWFADKESGKKAGLDVIAAELSEYGIPVTENDIVEFILEHPGNSVKKRSKVSMTAERRFKQLIKDLTGENVGGLESNSGRLVLAGLMAGVRAEQEKQALPYDMFTIPDSIVNFFEETGLNPDDFNSFEELNDAVQRELESGTFVFPLGPTDLQTINNIVQHGIKQQANYTDFASRAEKAGTQRAAQQPIFETAAGTQLEPITIEPRTEAGTESTEYGTTEQVTGEEIEYTPEDMAEIDAAIETRPLIEVIQETAVVNEINEAEKDVDVEPTEAQKEAGNYKKGHIKLNGFDITIENPKGSQRSGIDADGKKWSIEMANSYGYIKGTKGKDNDQVDIFLGDSPLSDKVFVVDQVNKDGSFDEHKCMIGFNTIEEAESAYLSNYEKGWTGLGSITEMPVDEFREWVKEGKKVEPASEEVVVEEQPQSTKTALEIANEETKKLDENKADENRVNNSKKKKLSAKNASSTSEKIDDFGEKIGGAKKDLVKEYRDRMESVTEDNVLELPLSKSFPRPDFKRLVEESVITENQAVYMSFLYDKIKIKPRDKYKSGRWASRVKEVIDLFNEIIDGKSSPNLMDEAISKVNTDIPTIKLDMEAYRDVMVRMGFPKNAVSLGKYEVKQMWNKSSYYITKGNIIVKKADTYDEILDMFVELLGKPKAKKEVKLDVYKSRKTGNYFIGKGIQGKEPITLSKEFESKKEVFDYLKNNRDELVKLWEKISVNPEERRESNRKRKGVDWRESKNVTPEQFGSTFGFRGVEFGNWVNKSERQEALNDAYDALMDLSSIVGLSPRALSLGGKLGLAFGARGGSKASAHYEPGKVVINLTKTKGAGSLAHEWFHALDNYFSRMRGNSDGFLTRDTSRKHDDNTRQELLDSFKDLMDSITKSDISKRSKKLDSTRSKAYWAEDVEMAARAFESYVIDKLNSRDEHNDYLANVKDMNEWYGEGESDIESYPYPNEEEAPIIGEKFDQLFQAIEETEDEHGNQILFSDETSETDQIKTGSVNEQFNNELQMQIDGVLPKGHIYKLGMPSDVLLSAGVPNLPIEMKSDRLYDKSKQDNHPFELSNIINLPDAIQKPIAVFESKTQPESKVILTEITSGEKNFVVAIRAQKHKTSGRRTLLVNEIRSLYPKDTQQIVKWIESKELLRWVDKKKAINWLGKQQSNSADVAIPYDSSTAANIVNNFENPTLVQGNILSEIELLSSSLNTPVRVVRDISEIKDSDKDLEKRMLRSRGWYDTRTGEVVIVLANNKSVAEAQSTVLHEVVGHMGLRKLLGSDFNQTMSSIYDSLPKDVQKSLMDKYGSKLVAAEEYASEMAETLSDPGIVQRIASAFKQAMRKLGINLKMTDGDIMTLLWKSKNRLTDGDSAADIVRKIGKEDKVKSEARVFDRVFRDGTLAEAIEQISDDPIIKQRMHAAVKSRSFQLQEGYQDRMLAVKKMQQLLEEQKRTKLPDYMNVYMFENTLSSRNTYEIEQYNENYYKPMMDSITSIIKNGDTLRDIEDYAIAKHGIERNDLFRLNALKEEVENLAKNNAYLEWLPDDVRSDSKKFQDRVEGDKKMLLEEIGEGKFSEIEGLSIEPFEALRKRLWKKDYSGLTALEAEHDAPASDIVKSFESRNERYIDGLWKSINKATKASLKKWFDSGMIAKDTFNKINGMYSHYVPLRGFAEETASDVYEYFTEQESAFNSPLRKADGRKSKPETPFAHILSMAGSSIVGGNKNIMKLHLLRLAQAHPSDYMTADKTWYVDNGKVDPETGKPMYDPVFPEYSEDINTYRENVEQFEMEMNELREQGIAFKGVKKLKPGYKISKIESSEHMVRALLNGEEYHILVHGDPRVAQAVNGINDKGRQESAFMKKIAWANRQMAANFTTRNPAFIASNLVRDVIFASTALSIKEGSSYTMKFEKNIFGGAGGALKRFLQGKPDMSKQEDVYLKEFLENGGETGYTALYNIDKYKKIIEKDARQGKKADARKKYMSVIDFFANGARWAEDLSRFSVYMASRQSGRSVLRSVSDAKEVTVNFNRKGSGSYGAGFARAAYLFFNAAVQSLSNAAVLMKNNPVKGTAALMSYASVGALIPAIIASLGDDDDLERYNNLPDYVRKNHLCIPVGDMFVKIPLPIELRAFYGLGDQMYRTLSGLDGMGESLTNIALSFMDLLPLNPAGGGDVLGNILPDATVPFYEAYGSNKDFTGKPIAKVTPFNEWDPEYKKVYKSANEVPVYVSQFLNYITGGDDVKKGGYDKVMGALGTPVSLSNPAAFEHLFGSYFGGLWTTLNHVYKSTENVVKAAVQEDFDAGENQVWRTAPILNRFVDEGTFNGSLGKINERYFNAVREMRETKHLIKGYEDKLGEQLTASEAAKVAAKISDIMKGDQAKRMYIIEDYSKEIQSLNKESENASRDRKVQVNDRINELKERMLEKLKEY